MAGPVLFLGRDDSQVLARLRASEAEVVAWGAEAPLTPQDVDRLGPSTVISHGYRVILRPPTLDRLPDRVFNLHISYLPFNRGAHPVLWSVLDGTPAGVTIHYVDPGVDTGDIVAQRRVPLLDEWTLADAYARLQDAMVTLFEAHWPAIRAGTNTRRPQPDGGTEHRVADLQKVAERLSAGWRTRIGDLRH